MIIGLSFARLFVFAHFKVKLIIPQFAFHQLLIILKNIQIIIHLYLLLYKLHVSILLITIYYFFFFGIQFILEIHISNMLEIRESLILLFGIKLHMLL